MRKRYHGWIPDTLMGEDGENRRRLIEKYGEHFSEKDFGGKNRVTLYKFIGKPVVRKVDHIPDEEIEYVLKELLDVMAFRHVTIQFGSEIPAREIYRFITEELFKEKVENSRIYGMTTHFVYEEFYPEEGEEGTLKLGEGK